MTQNIDIVESLIIYIIYRGISIPGWFIMEHPFRCMDDLVVPPFQATSMYIYIYIYSIYIYSNMMYGTGMVKISIQGLTLPQDTAIVEEG
jgi:hypothetical protein